VKSRTFCHPVYTSVVLTREEFDLLPRADGLREFEKTVEKNIWTEGG
jgi:hypothetical protein